jgi:hypothetical protein
MLTLIAQNSDSQKLFQLSKRSYFKFLKQPAFKLSKLGHVRFRTQSHNIINVEEENQLLIHIEAVDAGHWPQAEIFECGA